MKVNPTSGTTIDGKYRLLSPLGAGAMGAVWLATQLSVDRKVAIKLLHPTESKNKGLDARFEVEAKAIARLNHPNCITLYDFGYSDELNSFYTVIEYVKGIALGQRVGVSMGFNDAVNIVRQVALGLDHAHFHNILHRDLKPDNLMLAEQSDGTELLKILDFGIAKIVNGEFGVDSGDDAIRLTKAGEVFGTPAYMSPEQARSTRELTPASDFYALGVIFYEMIEGVLPFTAGSSFDVLMMHVTEEVPRLRRQGVPEKITDVIYKLLEKDPKDRFQSGREIMEALGSEAFSSAPLQIPGTSPVPTENYASSSELTFPPQSLLTTQNPRSSKKPALLILALIAFISMGGLGYYFISQSDSDSPVAVEKEIPSAEKSVKLIQQKPSAPVRVEKKEEEISPKTEDSIPEEVEGKPASSEEAQVKALVKKEKRKSTPKKILKKVETPKKKEKKSFQKLQLVPDRKR